MDEALKQVSQDFLSYKDVKVSIKMKENSDTDATIRLSEASALSSLAERDLFSISFYVREHKPQKYQDRVRKGWLKDMVDFFNYEDRVYDVKLSMFKKGGGKSSIASMKNPIKFHEMKFSLVDATFYKGYDKWNIEMYAYKPEDPYKGFRVFIVINPHETNSAKQAEAPKLKSERRFV